MGLGRLVRLFGKDICHMLAINPHKTYWKCTVQMLFITILLKCDEGSDVTFRLRGSKVLETKINIHKILNTAEYINLLWPIKVVARYLLKCC